MNNFPGQSAPEQRSQTPTGTFPPAPEPHAGEPAASTGAPASQKKRRDGLIAAAVAILGSVAVVAGIFLYPVITGQNEPQASAPATAPTTSAPANPTPSVAGTQGAKVSPSPKVVLKGATSAPSATPTPAEQVAPIDVNGVKLDASMFASPEEAKATFEKIEDVRKAGDRVLVGTVKVQGELDANEAIDGRRLYILGPNSTKHAIFYLEKPVKMTLGAVGGMKYTRPVIASGLGDSEYFVDEYNKWKKFKDKHLIVRVDKKAGFWPSEASVPLGQPYLQPEVLAVIK
ncbi:hypothetical protein J2S49_001183 [Arcanobacterium wilhelmae]|uniref:Uncharacterized protein n=1 Tax=Arcanobacterium wilhelmae TaxID=1803177 RepID=A0ABT9NBQ0_9ACTO|nr:hypothetical protein [Arcanobacterium wilhelmae]MDP9801107.1 hypothetical protein [Arcanobacterium wilhelmae]WFN90461.1 hypothetical protein P8A24_00950 [Arcanobacterium wilhelmae]